MTISFTHSQTQTRINRCIKKILISARPDKQDLFKNEINTYIDNLYRELVVSSV